MMTDGPDIKPARPRVVSIKPKAPDVDPGVIAALEAMLLLAKAGKIDSFVCVSDGPDGAEQHIYTTDATDDYRLSGLALELANDLRPEADT